MAKFTFEYDSETKELVVMANGGAMQNVRDVMFYGNSYEGGSKKWEMGIIQYSKNADGTRTVTKTMAATAENLQEAEAAQASAPETPAAILSRIFAKS